MDGYGRLLTCTGVDEFFVGEVVDFQLVLGGDFGIEGDLVVVGLPVDGDGALRGGDGALAAGQVEVAEGEGDGFGDGVVLEAEDVAVEAVGDVGGEAVVAAGVGADVFPEGAGLLGHVGEIAGEFVFEPGAGAVAAEQFESEVVADEGVGHVDFGEGFGGFAVGAELVAQGGPELGVGFG